MTASKSRATEIRERFLSKLQSTGAQSQKITGTEIYTVSGNVVGLIYLHIRSTGKPFFGMQQEFLKIFLGDKTNILSPIERDYLINMLSDTPGAGKEPPPGWRFPATIVRRLLLVAKNKGHWACVLLLGRDDKWVCNGWILDPVNVAKGMHEWSFSPSQGAYKINENNLLGIKKHLGLEKVASAVVNALSNSNQNEK